MENALTLMRKITHPNHRHPRSVARMPDCFLSNSNPQRPRGERGERVGYFNGFLVLKKKVVLKKKQRKNEKRQKEVRRANLTSTIFLLQRSA